MSSKMMKFQNERVRGDEQWYVVMVLSKKRDFVKDMEKCENVYMTIK